MATLLRSLEEPSTLDVLSLGTIRDAFADILSPGTSTVQTRLRYFIFLPERHVPIMPFSQEAAALPRLRKALAAYRLAFGQARQEELVEFLAARRTDSELAELAERLRIDLSPPP